MVVLTQALISLNKGKSLKVENATLLGPQKCTNLFLVYVSLMGSLNAIKINLGQQLKYKNLNEGKMYSIMLEKGTIDEVKDPQKCYHFFEDTQKNKQTFDSCSVDIWVQIVLQSGTSQYSITNLSYFIFLYWYQKPVYQQKFPKKRKYTQYNGISFLGLKINFLIYHNIAILYSIDKNFHKDPQLCFLENDKQLIQITKHNNFTSLKIMCFERWFITKHSN